MRKRKEDRRYCRRCRERFRLGDACYEVPGDGLYCPDCAEALFESWRREEGDVVDRC